jgi:hypothetical protein
MPKCLSVHQVMTKNHVDVQWNDCHDHLYVAYTTNNTSEFVGGHSTEVISDQTF